MQPHSVRVSTHSLHVLRVNMRLISRNFLQQFTGGNILEGFLPFSGGKIFQY